MTIVQRGSRNIVVDAIAYRWSIRPRPTYSQGLAQNNLRFAVELKQGASTTLLVTVDAARPDNWMIATASIISSSAVEHAIRRALNEGWRPAEKGSVFKLSICSAERL